MATSVEASSLESRGEEEVLPPHMDFCSPLPPVKAITRSSVHILRPYTREDDAGEINFRLAPDKHNYLESSFIRITGKMRIVKENGEPIAANTEVCPQDNFGSSWIKKIVVTFGNTRVEPMNGSNYHLRSHISTLLNFSSGAAKSHLRCSGFYEGEGLSAAVRAANADHNAIATWGHLTKLKEMFAESKYVPFSSEVFCDVLRTPRDILNDLPIEISITKHEDRYVLIRNVVEEARDQNNFKYQLRDVALHIRKIKPAETQLLANERRLASSSAKYPFQNWRFTQVILPQAQRHFTSQGLFANKIPSRTIYCIMTLRQDRGAYDTNSLVFKPHGLKRLTQTIDGLPAPIGTQEYDFPNDLYTLPYRAFLDNLGLMSTNRSNYISYEAFKHTRWFACFNNSSSGLSYGSMYREKEGVGDLCVSLEFAENLDEGLVLQCFGLFDDYFEIDQQRNVTINSTRE